MLRATAWMLLAGLVLSLVAGGQETPAIPPAGTTPLGVRQQRVERMMEELERKFRTLRQSIEKNEPDRAKRLEETYNKAKELLIQQRMGDITKLLDQARLDTATDGQKAILADIRTLLEILLDEKSDREKAREEFERLSQWKKEIENLISQERGEKRESDKVANKEKTLADMQARIQALEAGNCRPEGSDRGHRSGPSRRHSGARQDRPPAGRCSAEGGVDCQPDRQGSWRREGTVRA